MINYTYESTDGISFMIDDLLEIENSTLPPSKKLNFLNLLFIY